MEIFPGISMDPGIRFGKPCLTGTTYRCGDCGGGAGGGREF